MPTYGEPYNYYHNSGQASREVSRQSPYDTWGDNIDWSQTVTPKVTFHIPSEYTADSVTFQRKKMTSLYIDSKGMFF